MNRHCRFRSIHGLAASLLLFFMAGCSGSGEPRQEMATASDEIFDCLSESWMNRITLEEVQAGHEAGTLRLSGQISANLDRVYRIYPAAGGVVTGVDARVGDRVEQGEILATIESPDIAEFHREKLDVMASITLAERNLELARSLFDSGVYSRRDLLEAERALNTARAELERINRRQQVLGIDEDEEVYTIKAPESGFVVARNLNRGMNLRADHDGMLFKISDLREVWVVANVYETDIRNVVPGTPVHVDVPSWPDRTFSGEIVRVSNVLDPGRRVLEAIVELPNPDFRLKPGMFATIRVEVSGEETLTTIPDRALIFDDNRYFVVVYRDSCDVEVREVRLRGRNGEQAFIESGLEEGETIVSRGQLLVYNELVAN